MSLRPPRRLAIAVAVGPVVERPRTTAPRLWAPSGDAPTSERTPPPRPAEARAPGSLVPPAPGRAGPREVDWQLADGASRFRVLARPADGGGDPVTLWTSAPLAWPPSDARAVQALTDAVTRLEAALVDAGWTALPPGDAWYELRFAWRLPAASTTGSRLRHERLYDAEYEQQVERTERLRHTIAEQVLSGESENGSGPALRKPVISITGK